MDSVWHSWPLHIEIPIGLVFGLFVDKFESFFNENRCDNTQSWVFFVLGLVLGVYYLPSYKLELKNEPLLITAFSTVLILQLISHFSLLEEIKSSENKWYKKWIFQKYKKGKGYYIGNYEYENAYTSRFGLNVVGKKSFLNTLFGGTGWTKTQEKALVSHERGHTFVAIPMILLQVIGSYLILANSLSSVFHLVIVLIILFSFQTTLSWVDELLADVFAGPRLLTLHEILAEDGLLDFGSVGGRSHPPLLLRYIVAVISWPGILFFYYWSLKEFFA